MAIKQKEHDLASGVKRIVVLCKRALKRRKGTYVIGIGGPSSSGKGYLGKLLLKRFPSAVYLCADDYYHGSEYMRANAIPHFDDPRAIDLSLLSRHLELLVEGKPIQKPVYSFKTGEKVGEEPINPSHLIFVDGLFVGQEPIRRLMSLFVFVETNIHGAFWRRIKRDIKRTSQTPEEIAKTFMWIVHPSYVEHVFPFRQYAHVIIRNDMDAHREMADLPHRECHIKIRISPVFDAREIEMIEGILRKARLVKFPRTDQYDIFLGPPDSQVRGDSDEIIRVREEYICTQSKYALRKTLTYKTLMEGGERGILTFSFDGDFLTGLCSLGYAPKGVLYKKRSFYVMHDGTAEVALDCIIIPRGSLYLEIRAAKQSDALNCLSALHNAGLPDWPATNDSYANLLMRGVL